MKRRGFIGLAAGGLACWLYEVAHAVCNPALVRLFGKDHHLVQARAGRGLALGDYFIQWYGHSSFLIHSGSETKVVADPNFNVTPGIRADAVTVSNDHFTHNNTGAVAGNPVILRGITFRQTWNPIRTSIKDVVVVNIPSQRGAAWGGAANSIFVYEMGSICIAHLGNIGHLLTPEQQKVLQRVDVMMIPVDATTNLGFDDLHTLIEQVKPPVVIPMHYDVAQQGESFAAFAHKHYPVRKLDASQLTLNRGALPKSTEVFLLKHPRASLFGD